MNDKQATPERPKYNRDRIRHDIEHHVSIDLDTKTMEEVIDCVEDAITLTKWFADDETPDGGWVDVKEKLPQLGLWVLVSCWEPEFPGDTENGYSYVAQYYGDNTWAAASELLHFVTHWMPLPPPPQRVETNNDLTTSPA